MTGIFTTGPQVLGMISMQHDVKNRMTRADLSLELCPRQFVSFVHAVDMQPPHAPNFSKCAKFFY